MGNPGVKLKYGPIKGTHVGVKGFMGASEVIKAASGRFVTNDGSGYLDLADDGDTLLSGWVEAADQTSSSTAGATDVLFLPATLNLGVVFRIPVNAGTFVISMRGKSCDLARTTNIQGAKLDGSGEDVLLIIDGDAVNNEWVDVTFNPEKIALTGVV
jgi:hypothetical protein